jgi:glycerol kinase
MCGGSAASEVTPQIVADTTGYPIDCSSQPETSSIGAAICARKLLEPGHDLARLAARMKPQIRRIAPGVGREEAARRFEEYVSALPRLDE